MTEKTIQPGSKVRFHYSITLEDGTVADSSFDDDPIEITLGDGQLHESLELALIGLGEGEEQTIGIDPDQGFGYHDPEAVHELPLGDFPDDLSLEPGQIINFSTPSGEELLGRVVEIKDAAVSVDLNHPLAGHTLSFRTKIMNIDR